MNSSIEIGRYVLNTAISRTRRAIRPVAGSQLLGRRKSNYFRTDEICASVEYFQSHSTSLCIAHLRKEDPHAAPKSPAFAAAYIRVSTDDQAELSPESQLVEIQKYARREGIVLLSDHIYVDAGISGKKADRRPEFQRMIAAAKSNPPFSILLVWKFSRFARNQEESIFYKSILRSKLRRGCGVHFGTAHRRSLRFPDRAHH